MKRFDDKDRCQFQSWYVKLWRMRHLLLVPKNAVMFYIHNPDFYDRNFLFAWKTALGVAHLDMGWIYTMEEVKETLRKSSK